MRLELLIVMLLVPKFEPLLYKSSGTLCLLGYSFQFTM